MGSLFRRFFVSFFLTTLLMVAVVATVGALFLALRSSELELPRYEGMRSEAEVILRVRGTDELAAWLAMNRARMRPIRVDVVDAAGRSVIPGNLDTPQLPGADRMVNPLRGAVISRPVTDRDGKPYTFVMFIPNSRKFGVLSEPSVLATLGFVTLIVILVACLVVARSLTTPIEELRVATRRLARGNLEAGIGPRLLGRQDEIGQLARDFDSMSDSMRRLLDSKQQLVRDLSHELRTPIARMRMALGLAAMRPQEARDSLARAEHETERLDELIERMLQLSRISDPAWHPAFEPIAVGDMLRGLAQDAATECEARRVTIQIEAPDDLRVEGVPEQLRSACENVLRNALRYSPEGGEIRLRAFADENDCVITTEDQGPGVPQELLERIFQPLYRVKATRDGAPSGHGIGLAIVARVAALHGGRVFATNRAEGGLRLTLRIRLAQPA